MGLTESSLLCLLYRKGDGRQQFDENLYDDLRHCRGRWHFCVNVEALEERFERLEKLDERVVARASNILDCLMEAIRVKKSSPVSQGRALTPRSMAIPANIALAGGKG